MANVKYFRVFDECVHHYICFNCIYVFVRMPLNWTEREISHTYRDTTRNRHKNTRTHTHIHTHSPSKREEWILVNWKKHTQCARRLALIPLIWWNSREAHRKHKHTHTHFVYIIITIFLKKKKVFRPSKTASSRRAFLKCEQENLRFKYNSLATTKTKTQNIRTPNIFAEIDWEKNKTEESESELRRKSQIQHTFVHANTFHGTRNGCFRFIAFGFWWFFMCVA